LPAEVRELLPSARTAAEAKGPGSSAGLSLRTSQLPEEALDKCWEVFNEVLRTLERRGRLGAVLLQHQSNVVPGAAARKHTEEVRRRLLPSAAFAVEFRNRAWIQDDEVLAETAQWLDSACGGAALVCSDDLLHELLASDRAQRGLAPGEVRQRLPLRMALQGPGWAYCRIHRRHGNVAERTLLREEVADWCAAVRRTEASGALRKGACYILLGTDARDAPVQNARLLASAAGTELTFDWASHCHANVSRHTLAALWGAAAKAKRPVQPGRGVEPTRVDGDIAEVCGSQDEETTPTKQSNAAGAAGRQGCAVSGEKRKSSRPSLSAQPRRPAPLAAKGGVFLARGASAHEEADVAEALRRSRLLDRRLVQGSSWDEVVVLD